MSDKSSSKTSKIQLSDILQWMLDNKDDYDAMDHINRVSFAYMRGIRGRDY